MTHPSKLKGNAFEREIVRLAEEYGWQGRRAWGSNGESLGSHKDVDVQIWDGTGKLYELGLKIRKTIPKWLGLSDHVDGVVIREARGQPILLIPLHIFLEK